jgi:hypothetical protein
MAIPMAIRSVALTALMILVAGCASSAPVPFAVPLKTNNGPAGATPGSDATPTPLASARPVPAAVTPKPKPKATPKPKVTKAPVSYYKPPGWDGVSDVDCPDFDTHAHAQSFFEGTGGSRSYDPYRLDADHDGSACEALP